jgi:DNA-binding transcriptional MerR regulator
MENVQQLLPVSLAARLLGITPDGVRHLERTGKLPALKLVTGQRLFLKEDVLRLVAERAHNKVGQEVVTEVENVPVG